MDQFSKVILMRFIMETFHEGYSIDTSGNEAEPAEGLSPEISKQGRRDSFVKVYFLLTIHFCFFSSTKKPNDFSLRS